jgi:hypothetical protein
MMTGDSNNTSALTPIVSGTTPAHFQPDDFGRGLGGAAPDELRPMIIGVAQAGTPALREDSADHIPGLVASEIYVRDADPPRYPDGIDVVPCNFRDTLVEWRQNRQGLAEIHDPKTFDRNDIERHNVEGRRPVLIRRSTGNVLEPTREIHCLILPALLPAMLPCWSTRLTFCRQWRLHMIQQRDANGNTLPSYGRRYKLTTVLIKKSLGSWFGLRFENLGPTTDAQVTAGRDYCKFVESNAVRVIGGFGDA